MDYPDFIALIPAHNPDKGKAMIGHYGLSVTLADVPAALFPEKPISALGGLYHSVADIIKRGTRSKDR